MNKAQRKRRQNRARFKRWYDRQKALEAAQQEAQERERAAQRAKEQTAREAQLKAEREAEAARKAALPPLPCMFGFGDPRGSCPHKACDNRKLAPLCQYHFDMLYPPPVLEDGTPAPDITAEEVRQYNRRKAENENPYIWRSPHPTGDLADQLIATPPTATYSPAGGWTIHPQPPRRGTIGEYSEAGGYRELPDPAVVARQQEAAKQEAAHRTWSQKELVQFHIDTQQKGRTDE